MIVCDRKDFIDCCNGDLLINERGSVTCLGDRATAAVKASDEGHDVFLTHNGVIVSVMVDFSEMTYEDYLRRKANDD